MVGAYLVDLHRQCKRETVGVLLFCHTQQTEMCSNGNKIEVLHDLFAHVSVYLLEIAYTFCSHYSRFGKS